MDIPKEDINKRFITIVLGLTKLAVKIKDHFFLSKFDQKLSEFINTYIFMAREREDNVAQYLLARNYFIRSIEANIDFLEYLEHLDLVDLRPLLLVKRCLLKFKITILVTRPDQPNKQKSQSKTKTAGPPKLSSNQEMIFDFVKKSPNARTKDIVEGFVALSERTVKRNLGDLVKYGFLKKKSSHKAVHYSIADGN